MDTDEALAVANAIVIEVEPQLSGQLDDEQLGQVACWPRTYGFEFTAVAKPDLTGGQAAAFEDWVRERAFHLALRGDPDHVDGWYRRSSDDGWQITCRLVWSGDGHVRSCKGRHRSERPRSAHNATNRGSSGNISTSRSVG